MTRPAGETGVVASLFLGYVGIYLCRKNLAVRCRSCRIVDAVGYVGGILAGEVLGRLLDLGGYGLGFRCLSAVTVVAALMSWVCDPLLDRAAPSSIVLHKR